MKIAMYGSGAAGSVFASYLKKGGADMILIDRYEAHMKKVAEDGMHFTIHQEENGAYTDYNYQLKGFRTYTSSAAAAEAEGKVDVIIYMTKATQLEQAIQDSLPVVGDTTVAVSLTPRVVVCLKMHSSICFRCLSRHMHVSLTPGLLFFMPMLVK